MADSNTSSPENTPVKRFRNNEIFSSLSSSSSAIRTSGGMVAAATKRKQVDRETDSDSDVDYHQLSSKKPLLHSSVSSEDSESVFTHRNSIPSAGSMSFSSDKENGSDETMTDKPTASKRRWVEVSDVSEDEERAEPVFKKRDPQQELFDSCTPHHYHTLEEHQEDDQRRQKRVKRLLQAIKRGTEERDKAKERDAVPTILVVAPSAATPVPVPSLSTGTSAPSIATPAVLPDGKATLSAPLSLVTSVPSSIPSVLPIHQPTLVPAAPPSLLKTETVTVTPSVTSASAGSTGFTFAAPSAPVVSFNLPTPVPSVPPSGGFNFSASAASIGAAHGNPMPNQLNTLNAIAGNFNFGAGSATSSVSSSDGQVSLFSVGSSASTKRQAARRRGRR